MTQKASSGASVIGDEVLTDEYYQRVVEQAHKLMELEEFQDDRWQWLDDLDDDGLFLFCYMFQDYYEKTLTASKYEETVYTISLLMHKLLPPASKSGLSKMEELQIILALYETMKKKEMPWDACEAFITSKIADFQSNN